ncbi:MAG: tRNA lysidine(34) synthetase TilS [bacterium]|nr:tRNA lysidine(34) synthetase TilS [bacterium]
MNATRNSSASAQDDLIEAARRTIDAHALIQPDEKVLVAVSGGPDSVCLLHVLQVLGHSVEVAHFDHQTRDGESREDAAFVAAFCERHGIVCHMGSAPVEEEAAASSRSFEEHARMRRYEYLLTTATNLGCLVLATGHHADDQAETVLMRVLRGTSPQGLAGIPPQREESGVRIVRPLLHCTRGAIERHLDENHIQSCEDRTNMDRDHVRNRIRHDLLPQLRREYNSGIAEALTRLADVQRVENDFLAAHTEAFFTECMNDERVVDRARFATGHPALQRRAVLMLAWSRGVDCGFDLVTGAVAFIVSGAAGRSFDLGGVLLRNSRDVTEVVSGITERDVSPVVLNVPGKTLVRDQVFRVRLLDAPPAQPLAEYCSPARQVFDADRLGEPLAVRLRRDGDRFSPLGLGGSKKLKDYFIDLGMPAGERESQRLLTGPNGIAWVIGLAVDESVAVTSATQRVLEVEVLNAD